MSGRQGGDYFLVIDLLYRVRMPICRVIKNGITVKKGIFHLNQYYRVSHFVLDKAQREKPPSLLIYFLKSGLSHFMILRYIFVQKLEFDFLEICNMYTGKVWEALLKITLKMSLRIAPSYRGYIYFSLMSNEAEEFCNSFFR